MGYLTEFELCIDSPNGDEQAIMRTIRENNDTLAYAVDSYGATAERCKWYDSDRDMISISKTYPEALFTLSGNGEEPNDTWRKFFKNGKLQGGQAKIKYPEYDPTWSNNKDKNSKNVNKSVEESKSISVDKQSLLNILNLFEVMKAVSLSDDIAVDILRQSIEQIQQGFDDLTKTK